MTNRCKKLTNDEKLTIQRMMSEGKTITEIATDLKRSYIAIQNYTNNFKELISKINVDATPDEDMPQNEFVSRDMYNKALQFMNMQGLSMKTARSKLNITIGKLLSTPSSHEDLAKVAFGTITADEVMINKSIGGRSGIMIMTEAASYHGDIKKKTGKSNKRSGVLYDAKTGKPM